MQAVVIVDVRGPSLLSDVTCAGPLSRSDLSGGRGDASVAAPRRPLALAAVAGAQRQAGSDLYGRPAVFFCADCGRAMPPSTAASSCWVGFAWGTYREMTEKFRGRSDHLESLQFCAHQYVLCPEH